MAEQVTTIFKTLKVDGKGILTAGYGPYSSVEAAFNELKEWDAIDTPFTFGVVKNNEIEEYWITKNGLGAEEGNTPLQLSDISLKQPVKLLENGFKVGEFVFTVSEN